MASISVMAAILVPGTLARCPMHHALSTEDPSCTSGDSEITAVGMKLSDTLTEVRNPLGHPWRRLMGNKAECIPYEGSYGDTEMDTVPPPLTEGQYASIKVLFVSTSST